jgi:hypothetical protein
MQIGELHHLRYLSLRGTDVSKLPSSLQQLRYLETLDIQDTKVKKLPHGVVKLEKLRYILAGVKFSRDLLQKVAQVERDYQNTNKLGRSTTFLCGNRVEISNMDQLSVRAPEDIEKLTNLHMLGAFNVGRGNGLSRRLGDLTNLHTLGVTITCLTDKGTHELCQSIGKLSQLQKLEVRSHSLGFLAKMDESRIPKHLASLKLLGDLLRLPKWISSLNDLTKVKLLGTKLEQGQVDILGNLPSVAFLGLWEKSYIGESLRFKAGQFPMLRFLDIDGLEKIQKVKIKESKLKVIDNNGTQEMVHAMPELEQLWVNNCEALRDNHQGLSGVLHLVNLNELLVKQCGDKEILTAILQEHVSKHQKRPKFLIGKIIPPKITQATTSQPSTSTTTGP